MESDNYIDRLHVDLKLQSTYKPYEAQEAADSIVDKHILPTVESVLEDMGRDIDVSIPKIEINVGLVRLQDLRDILESKLRSSLERQMSLSAVSSIEALREFAGTGKAPWEKRDRPFSPPQFLREVLEEDADTVMAQVSGFSEKELVGLLMAVPPSFARQWDGKGRAILDCILDRLMRISPETAAVITARQSFWRNYLNLSEASVSAAVSVTEEVGFKYVEIDLQEIPEGVSVEVSDYIDTPGPEAPEFIMTPGPPVEYYRKVAAAEAEITPPAVTEADASGQYTASGSFTSAPEPVYRYVEIDLREIPEGVSVEDSDYIDTPGPEASEFIMTPGPSGKFYRKVTVAEAGLPPVTLSYSVPPVVLPAEDTGSALQNLPEEASEVSRAAGTSSGSASSGTKRPEYGMEKEIAFTNSGSEPAGQDADMPRVRQDVPPTREDAHPERSKVMQKRAEALRQSVDARQHKAETRQDRDGVQEQRAKAQQGQPGAEPELEKVLQPVGEASALKTAVNVALVDKKNSLRAELPVFRYVEIDRRDIPEEASIAISDFVDALGPDAPDYIMTVGSPKRFFKKTIIEKGPPLVLKQEPMVEKTPWAIGQERVEEGTAGDTPAIILPAADRHRHSRSESHSPLSEPGMDIWAVQGFESELTGERIPVSDAGLVLLHPFLHLLMRNLGLTKKGKFVSSLARVRAVHLLRDLTGSPEPHFSQNLILEKILCGLPPGYALPPEWEPDWKEKEESEAMLKAVCGHWRSLSGSSVKALCDGFILRPGTVERFEETWIVKVEGRTIDILMEDLPWELSMILLPWLDHPIPVEWQHE